MFSYYYGLLFKFGIIPEVLSTECDHCNLLLTAVVRCVDNTCCVMAESNSRLASSLFLAQC